jgi:hypothetical protein
VTWKPTGVRPTLLALPACLEFSPDGGTLAAGLSGAGVAFWETRTGRLLGGSSTLGSVISLAFRPDGRRLAAIEPAHGKVVMLSVTGGSTVFTVDGPGRIESVAFSPDGRRVAAAGRAGDVGILDAETGQGVLNLRRLSPQPQRLWGFRALVTFSPDGRRLAATNWDGHITIWDVHHEFPGIFEEGERLAALRAGEIDFRADVVGEIAAAGFAGPLFSRLKQLLDTEPFSDFAYRCAAVLAAAGDRGAYRRVIRSLFAHYADTKSSENAAKVALLAALIPDAADDSEAVVALARRAHDTGDAKKALYYMTHALALHRAGRDAEAVRTYIGPGEPSIDAPEAGPMLQLALALAYQHLGKPAEARARIHEAGRLIREVAGPEGLDRVLPADSAAWLRCRVLLREAEAKILYDRTIPADPFAR